MTLDPALADALWPYFVVLFAGFLPSEIWRWSAVFLSRGFTDQDEVIIWVRCVSGALLTSVVAKLLISPSGALTAVPLSLRIGALVAGVAASLLLKRSTMVAILAGEAVLLTGAWLLR
ncbi:MAG: AzlD domain-containing protein [Beijerinckiaceae bacterium]|nr:AzlD domain-containing protein [Beijerinckiaceae bacterium]